MNSGRSASSIVLINRRGTIVGYLNATPQEGRETLSDWGSFRIDHNGDEGDHDIKLLATAQGLRLAGGRASCVIDDYQTISDRHYREIACLVAGRSSTTVIVAAAPPSRWHAERSLLQRAVSAFTT